MQGEQVTMSRKEVDRLGVIQALGRGDLRQDEAASQLGLSVRQVKRLLARYRGRGAAGLVSGHRGRAPSNVIAQEVRERVLALVGERYRDFGPSLASEKLLEYHGLRLSRETLRQWMIAEGLWRPKRRRQGRVHQRRARRPCVGELVQIDGSPHDWFEGRGPYCTLIVFIDDATSRLLALRFVSAETTWAYLEVLARYLVEHGRPVAFYSDKHSVFRINNCEREELSQFTRALKTLAIEPIHANSPQAKGRVERANQTLQDRLVKELRLRGISDMESANAYLPSFLQDYNARFAVAPQSPLDAHRPVQHSAEELALILCLHHARKLSKNLTFQYRNREYQIESRTQGYRLRGGAVTVCEALDGQVTVLHKGHVLPYRLLAQGEAPIALDDEKSVHATVDQAKRKQALKPKHRPAADHPWSRQIRIAKEKAEAKRGHFSFAEKGTF